ncbi:unnamed protein product [Toxocara canis]|uniref:tRNA(Phe) 7-((3-amino-3-carboxypropyl)-4-demethylwyosine(37)-N(4))-methyltransferase n=1 Tax=Toxocara canis TaxID=6265 RepID=A0A183VG33_TOXCA|nr:unnamed protein product [Toxocara canis]
MEAADVETAVRLRRTIWDRVVEELDNKHAKNHYNYFELSGTENVIEGLSRPKCLSLFHFKNSVLLLLAHDVLLNLAKSDLMRPIRARQ